jgi:hypothetical protein
MKRPPRISWLLMVFLLPALSACGGGAAPTPIDTAPIHTQIASTAMALQTQTALAMPPATNTPLASPSPEGTTTPLIAGTSLPGQPTPSATPLTLNTPLATSQVSCDNVKNVTDVNYADGYEAVPGEVMQKTWGFSNLGPCTWNQDYTLIFSYDDVGGASGWNNVKPVHFSDVVPAKGYIEVTVTLPAPNKPGTYKGVFRLRNNKGYTFGPEFWIQIVVK